MAAAAAITTPSSQSCLLRSFSDPPLRRRLLFICRSGNTRSNSSPPTVPFRISSLSRRGGRFITAIAPLNTDPVGGDINLGEESGGGGEGFGRGGGPGGGDGGGDQEEDSEGGSEKNKKMSGMSMSQKLTLGYAALVGGNSSTTHWPHGWSYGVREGWQPEVISCWRDVGLDAVLCVHTAPTETSFCVVPGAWSVCCTCGSDGFSLQQVEEDISSRRCISVVLCDGRWLSSWDSA